MKSGISIALIIIVLLALAAGGVLASDLRWPLPADALAPLGLYLLTLVLAGWLCVQLVILVRGLTRQQQALIESQDAVRRQLEAAELSQLMSQFVQHAEALLDKEGLDPNKRSVMRCLAVDALRGNSLGYTEALGIPELRAAIAQHYRDKYSVEVPVERIVVTTGSSGGFMLAILAAFDAGDRVAVGVPYYPAYSNMLVALGIEPVFVVTGPQTRFQPTADVLAAAGPLDGVLVASPANPTGTMLSAEAMAALVGYCGEAGVRLLSADFSKSRGTPKTLTSSPILLSPGPDDSDGSTA